MQTPIVIMGEALMDCIAQPNGSLIPYEGGSPYNVARAIARQGGTATFANPISTDELGTRLSTLLMKEGVMLGMPSSPLPTSLAMVSFINGQPSYQFYRDGVADRAFSVEQALAFLERFPNKGILHTGSLALVPPESDKTIAIIKAAKAQGWVISCDINLRPRLARNMDEYRHSVKEVLGYVDWLKASDEDLLTLNHSQSLALSASEADKICNLSLASQLASEFAEMGCSRIALTFGGAGAYLLQDGQSAQSAAPVITVVDTVGCGDTFWGTCLLSWAKGENNADFTLNRAIKAAALNATHAGCHPPSAAELI